MFYVDFSIPCFLLRIINKEILDEYCDSQNPFMIQVSRYAVTRSMS